MLKIWPTLCAAAALTLAGRADAAIMLATWDQVVQAYNPDLDARPELVGKTVSFAFSYDTEDYFGTSSSNSATVHTVEYSFRPGAGLLSASMVLDGTAYDLFRPDAFLQIQIQKVDGLWTAFNQGFSLYEDVGPLRSELDFVNDLMVLDGTGPAIPLDIASPFTTNWTTINSDLNWRKSGSETSEFGLFFDRRLGGPPTTGQLTVTRLDTPPVDPPVEPGPIPEPATWMMLILGFGLTGSALRWRGRSEAGLAAKAGLCGA